MKKICIYIKGVSSQFLRELSQFHKFEFILKVFLFYNSTRDIFPQFFLSVIYIKKKSEFILKVSLQEIPSTISQDWIYTKKISWRDTFHNCNINNTIKKNWIYTKRVSSRETFHNSTKLKISLKEIPSTTPQETSFYIFFYQSYTLKEIEFILRVYLQEAPFTFFILIK